MRLAVVIGIIALLIGILVYIGHTGTSPEKPSGAVSSNSQNTKGD